jgi:predicted RNA-binding protein YlqC (UPF0109 family)
MREFLEYLVKQLAGEPEVVEIAEDTDQAGITTLAIKVAPADMGKIIGRGGRIIQAIRDLVRILAIKENRRINVILAEEEKYPPPANP